MADTVQALQELLKLIADHPELADRITITIKPNKLSQGKDTDQLHWWKVSQLVWASKALRTGTKYSRLCDKNK